MSTKGEATRDRILASAVNLFHTNGFSNTSLDDIIRAAQVTKGSFYFYFKSKEELGRDVIARGMSHYIDGFIKSRLDEPGHPIDRIARVLSDSVANMEKNGCRGGCLFANLAAELSDTHPEFGHQLSAVFNRWTALVEQTLRAGQESGQVSPAINPAELATFVVATIEGALMLARVNKKISDLRTCAQQLTTYLNLFRR